MSKSGTKPFADGSVPRIAIDARMIGEVPHGIARYVKNLADGLSSLSSLRYRPVFLISPRGRSRIPEKFETIPVSAEFLSARELVELPLILRDLNPALYHSPSFSSLIYSPCPWVVTIHDLNHLHFGGLREKIYYATLLKSFAAGAKKILTVSEFSQRELSAWLGKPPSEIEIVYNAVGSSIISGSGFRMPQSLRGYALQPGAYFLFISHHLKPHKNSAMLLRAYKEAKLRDPALPPLALNATSEEIPVASDEKSGIIALGKLTDEELRFLLRNSLATVFPSLYEGFGLPALEAAMLGARVLVSDIPPHREALVDFSQPQVKWIKPDDADAWSEAFLDLKSNPVSAVTATFSEQLSRAQARFGVQALAEHMDQIYRSVLELG